MTVNEKTESKGSDEVRTAILSTVVKNITENTARTTSLEETVKGMAGQVSQMVESVNNLTISLTKNTVETSHNNKALDEIKESQKSLTDRVTVLEIDGASRETKLKMIIGVVTTALASVITFFINSSK